MEEIETLQIDHDRPSDTLATIDVVHVTEGGTVCPNITLHWQYGLSWRSLTSNPGTLKRQHENTYECMQCGTLKVTRRVTSG